MGKRIAAHLAGFKIRYCDGVAVRDRPSMKGNQASHLDDLYLPQTGEIWLKPDSHLPISVLSKVYASEEACVLSASW